MINKICLIIDPRLFGKCQEPEMVAEKRRSATISSVIFASVQVGGWNPANVCVCASEGTMINVQSKRQEKNIEIG